MLFAQWFTVAINKFVGVGDLKISAILSVWQRRVFSNNRMRK